jgi:hypothetical protein
MNDGEFFIALAGILATFGVPLVWILTAHQRKMAEIIHRTNQNQTLANNDLLANEMRELKQLVFQQSITIDSRANEVRKPHQIPQTPDPLSNRLG